MYVCGDWTRDPSINGAMESGGLAAAAVLKDLVWRRRSENGYDSGVFA